MDDNSSQARNQASQEPRVHTLSDFIENNHKLISVLGVFAALTAFSGNLPLRPLGYALSFVFLTVTIVVWIELWTKFPKRPVSWRLMTFENVLLYSTWGILAYWLLAYREIWNVVLVFPIWLIIVVIITLPVVKSGWFQRMLKWKVAQYTTFRVIIGYLLFFIALLIAGLIAQVVSPPVNRFLDERRQELDSLIIYERGK